MLYSSTQILAILAQYRYSFLFPLTVIEGPMVAMLAGFLSSQSFLNLVPTFIIVVAGDMVAGYLFYGLGRAGKENIIKKWGRFIGINHRLVKRMESQYSLHGGKLLFAGKFAHGAGGAFLVAAGMSKMSFRSFTFYNFLATLPKSLIFIIIGYYFGRTVGRVDSALEATTYMLVALTVLAVFALFTLRSKKLGIQTSSNK